MIYKKAIETALREALLIPDFQTLMVLRIPELHPEIILVTKSGRSYKGKFFVVMEKFSRDLRYEVWSIYRRMRNITVICDEPPLGATMVYQNQFLMQETDMGQELFAIFSSWRRLFAQHSFA
jgi:hypothetical protein